MTYESRIEQAKRWLGNKWLLAEPVNKPASSHVRTLTPNRWAALNHQIARILGGSNHV